MSGPRRRPRRKLAALAAAALCSVAPLLTGLPPAAGVSARPSAPVSGLPGVPLTLVAGAIRLPTGLAVARLSNGANGPVLLTIGPCIPLPGTPCSRALTQFSLIGSFKDGAGHPLYSDSAPASVSW